MRHARQVSSRFLALLLVTGVFGMAGRIPSTTVWAGWILSEMDAVGNMTKKVPTSRSPAIVLPEGSHRQCLRRRTMTNGRESSWALMYR